MAETYRCALCMSVCVVQYFALKVSLHRVHHMKISVPSQVPCHGNNNGMKMKMNK